MAKGDKKKMQGAVDTSVQRSEDATNRVLNENVIPTTNNMANYYNQAANQGFADYNDIMGKYRDLYASGAGQNQPGLERVNYNRPDEMNEAFGGYRNFMNTGGFSPEDIRDMRARGISPIRSIYANMQNELARQKNLQGGYAPNMAAALTRMRSGTSQQIADQVQNVNAEIARMRQQGMQFGTQGMGNLSVQDAELAQRAALANQNAGLEIARNNLMDPRFSAVAGMANLYGTSPGAASTFGNQVLAGQRNWLEGANQLHNVGNQQMQGQQMVAQTPSNFEVGMGRVGQGLQMGGQVAGTFMGLPTRTPAATGINGSAGAVGSNLPAMSAGSVFPQANPNSSIFGPAPRRSSIFPV